MGLGTYIRKGNFVCLSCRKVKRMIAGGVLREPVPDCCGRRLVFVSSNVPAQDDDRGWRRLADCIRSRVRK